MKYYLLSYDINQEAIEYVVDYDMADFDLIRLWTGAYFEGVIPRDVRLWVSKGGGAADYLANPISWPIISGRFWNLIEDIAGNDCQLLEASLFYEDTGLRVQGYSIMNVTRVVRAAKVDTDGEVGVSDLVLFRSNIPSDAHLFRLAESTTQIIISGMAVDRLSGHGLGGIALIPVCVH